jgi:ERCC4-type nuclease
MGLMSEHKPSQHVVLEGKPGVKPLTVIVDNSASDAPVTRLLREKNIGVMESYLKAGQYRVTDQCAIWHLTAEEFNSLVADRTIYRRIPEFKRAVTEPILLIEGDPMEHLDRVTIGALRGALAFVELIYMMANQGQNGMGLANSSETPQGEPNPTNSAETAGNGKNGNGHPPTDPAELQEYILRTIPNVSPAAARAMLKKFGSLRAVCSATAKDLSPLEGIGPSKAKKIAGFLSWLRD